jgi:hypothetical protein
LLKIYMMSRNFLVEFSGSFRYKDMSPEYKHSLSSSFPIWIHFISLSVLFLWLGIPGLCWIRVERVLLLAFEEMVSVFFPHLVWCWLYACHR